MRRDLVTRLLPAAIVAVGALAAPAGASAAGLKAPSLQTPAHDAHVEAIPAFRWGAVRGADRYEFQLSADANFGSIVGGRGKGSFQTRNTAATVVGSHPDGTYWWRVRAITAKGRAGSWSNERTIRKAWTTAPQLVGPVDGAPVVFPETPLVLRWTSVPRTYKYRVFIASDPALGSLVVEGINRGPVETSATVFSPGTSLPPGRYYWAVQTVDSAGHRGARSAVGSFVWSWPTATATAYSDLVADPRLADPRVAWDPVPGAVGYDVEINHSEDFAIGSKVCCANRVIGTSYSPVTILPNNAYYWRVRAIDAEGNSGQWNLGQSFDKNFGNVPPTIPSLRLADSDSDVATDLIPETAIIDTDEPVVRWDPVPGAASYSIEVVPSHFDACDWSTPNNNPERRDHETASTAWTPLSNGAAQPPVDAGPLRTSLDPSKNFVDGHDYCVRVYARSGRHEVISDVTQLGGAGARAFRYKARPTTPSSGQLKMTAGDYLAPVTGSLTPRVPLLTWKRILGADSYWVVVAKDQAFTTIVDMAVTDVPAYAPRQSASPRTYADDDTPYYWAVLPAHEVDGVGVSTEPAENAPRSFQKRSVAPARLWPAEGADVADQPVFRWTSGDASSEVPEGAKHYRLQVAVDPSFGELVDDVVTQATSYTAEDVYPADTVLHWRVRVTDVKDVGLAWSTTGTFRRRLQAPTLSEGNLTAGSVIPALTWTPVQGALSYDVHVDQSDGTRKDFNLRGTSFTPTIWYGTGVWRWQVRANFPNGSSRVASAYTAPKSFARRIPAPEGVRAERSASRILLGWEPVFNAKKYRVEFSDSNSFSKVGQFVVTENLGAAPDLSKPPFVNGGRIFWRVAATDEGDNLGGFAAGELRTARRMSIRATGRLSRGRTERIVVSILDADGDPVRKAKIRVSGVARSRAKRTGKRGTATFRLRARRRGTVVLRASRNGYQPAEARLVVG